MASLNKLAIRGIRSFDDKQIAVIEFFSPVTVIVGHNGSGKTTIIECLKYATTGDQPPNSRGGAFVHDPKMANEKEVKAQVKLRFHAANGQRMLAVRNLSVTVKKTAGLTMKTLESILSLADGNADKGGKRATISTKCAEIDSEIPHLLGVSKAVLENVIFCHQEDSYWPLAEPSVLKKKFDDIFEATRYTKALDSIKSLRKDRVAELKTDKERLDSLSREKSHSDKVKGRITDLQSSIAVKEMAHEQLRKDCDTLIMANKRFYESATKFREQYAEMQRKQDDLKRMRGEIDEALIGLKEMTETDQQLAERIANADRYTSEAETKLRKEDRNLQDQDEDLAAMRKRQDDLNKQHGQLEAEKRQHEKNIADRDSVIRGIASRYHLQGYDNSPLEREQIVSFIAKLNEMQSRQADALDKLQADTKSQIDELKTKESQLNTDAQLLQQSRRDLRKNIDDLQSAITNAELELGKSQSLSLEVQNVQRQMEEKSSLLEKIRTDIKSAAYETKLQELSVKITTLEGQRDALSTELMNLTRQSDARAKLDIKRSESQTKSQDVKNIIDINNAKFRKLVGLDIHQTTMERDLQRAIRDKERELATVEDDVQKANMAFQNVESTLGNLRSQAKLKRDRAKALERVLKDGLDDYKTVREAIKDANDELNIRKEQINSLAGTVHTYETFLKSGKAKKKCVACDRPLAEHEMPAFEHYVSEQIKKASPSIREQNEQEAADWEQELQRLQDLLLQESELDKLTTQELPRLDQEIKEQESLRPEAVTERESILEKLEEVKREMNELAIMKQHAITMTKLKSELERLADEIARLEESLSSTGSVKTTDEVQAELNSTTFEIRKLEKEKGSLSNDRDQQNNLLRRQESELHSFQLRESELRRQMSDLNALNGRITSMRNDSEDASKRLKELDSKIGTAELPIRRVRDELRQYEAESSEQIKKAQNQCQELRRESDELNRASKAVEMYVRNKRERLLVECEENIESCRKDIRDQEALMERTRDAIAVLRKDKSESASLLATIRGNVRVRKLRRDIVATEAAVAEFDLEESARARRQFDEKYAVEKKREGDMESEYARLGGELSSLKDQLKTLENDLRDFKDVNKRYTDQLIKVKMSDMANNDLEKYAKALDKAIMKYHSLKMEEVNDTMRHLWNKTYQGTDIDGIKIRSDVEGGATKRSINYRVVMTKDQVEMDMRGRCSAGQKMLASIIIRLALSDSFGQNCGILALDEPTNALDTDNIDALASSLVDIINERKNHANFQLIIITHDEGFLRKLGQADVMEYYWRVSRDARQKSVIERHRFG